MSDEHTKSYTADELRAMIARGEDRSDWERVRAMTEEELEAAIASDPDWKDVPRDWHKDAVPAFFGPKKLVSLRLDPDVLEFFRATGPRWQTRMNGVLRAYMRARQKGGGDDKG